MSRLIGRVWKRLGSLPAGVLIGALCGALIGGVLGRVYMRVIFLVDRGTEGARTDFGTAGQVTLGGIISLTILSAVTGGMGGALYIGLRSWLPGRSTSARGAAFGLLVSFGPGAIFLGAVDLTIFEPALPIFVGFVALFVLYGVGVARLTDRVSPPGKLLDRSGRSHRVVIVAGVALFIFAVLFMVGVVKNAGTCLSGDDNGGCAAPAK